MCSENVRQTFSNTSKNV
ncbi:hypothetical protein CRE_30547, partial [Caenorhabditis remanei]